jgi:Rap1a immunity proteins
LRWQNVAAPSRKTAVIYQAWMRIASLNLSNKGGFIMTSKAIVLFLLFLLILPALAGAVSEDDFRVRTTQNLINLCTAAPNDPLYPQAINFCYGYLVGAFHYYESSVSGPKAARLVCLPDPAPSRNDAVRMFIDWAKAQPQYKEEKPVETEFRFLIEKWPCKP